jgi:hypothetical protein
MSSIGKRKATQLLEVADELAIDVEKQSTSSEAEDEAVSELIAGDVMALLDDTLRKLLARLNETYDPEVNEELRYVLESLRQRNGQTMVFYGTNGIGKR